jgi:membrane-bound lytic murein transglycosylase B
MHGRGLTGGALLLLSTLATNNAFAAPSCRTAGSYESWLGRFEREAAAQGISQRAIAAAVPSLTYDQRIINIDRGQRVFTQTFLQFSDRMAAAYRIQRGQALIKTNAAVFARIEQQYGGRGHRGVLGAGKRLRRQHGQLSFAQRHRLPRL